MVRSDDGVIAFTLAPLATGVFVERAQVHSDNALIVQSFLFTDGTSFQRWCDADSVRFDYPLVHMSLKRDGDALFHHD
jgi:hypothetical protein